MQTIPANELESLAFFQSPEPAKLVADARRPRGRPPGSKNTVSTDEIEAKRRAKLADEKAKKVDEYSTKVASEINEQLLGFLMGQGVPANMLYVNGQPPVPIVNSNYTELANQIVVKPFTAKAVASFVVDLEYSDRGAKIAASISGGSVGMIIKGVIAGACVLTYVKGLADAYQSLKPLAEAYAEAQRQARGQE